MARFYHRHDLVGSLNMPLPITREVYGLTALHCQGGYAAHLIAIRDAAVRREKMSSSATRRAKNSCIIV
jgi:hypothetical protein